MTLHVSQANKPRDADRFKPGHVALHEHVFVVTGFNPANKPPDGESPKTEQFHVIATDAYQAMRGVLSRIPNLVPLGVANLTELKAMVLAMEAVRCGIKAPFNSPLGELVSSVRLS